MASTLLDRITIDDAQCGGRPCIRHMRIRVSDILSLLSAGATFHEILEDYPYLDDEDILAAIEYAARQIDHPVLVSAWRFLVDNQLPPALARLIQDEVGLKQRMRRILIWRKLTTLTYGHMRVRMNWFSSRKTGISRTWPYAHRKRD